MASPGVVELALIVTVMFGAGLLDQGAAAGKLMTGSSPIGAMVSSVLQRARWTAHSSFWSSSRAPASRTMASSLGTEGMTANGPKERPRADDIGAPLNLTIQSIDGVPLDEVAQGHHDIGHR